MIYLLLAAGAAADTSANFLALEQDWATDKVGLFFQHKDFETAWSNIERDIEPQLKAASASTLDFIFMGTGMTPIAELLVMARTYDLAKRTRPDLSWRLRVLFFDKIYRDADARVITRIGELWAARGSTPRSAARRGGRWCSASRREGRRPNLRNTSKRRHKTATPSPSPLGSTH